MLENRQSSSKLEAMPRFVFSTLIEIETEKDSRPSYSKGLPRCLKFNEKSAKYFDFGL